MKKEDLIEGEIYVGGFNDDNKQDGGWIINYLPILS